MLSALLLALVLATPKIEPPGLPKIGEHAVMRIDPESGPAFLCPQGPGDPPWRQVTCWMLAMLGMPPDRPFIDTKTGKPWEPAWKPVEDSGGG